MTIRMAQLDDIEHLIVLGWEMHQESRFQKMEFDVDKTANSLIQWLDADDCLLLVAEDKAGKIIGGFAGYAVAPWFSAEIQAGDFGLFLTAKHRGGMTAFRLVRKYLEWAKSKKAVLIQLGITTGFHVEQTGQLYERIGFKWMGSLFEYREVA